MGELMFRVAIAFVFACLSPAASAQEFSRFKLIILYEDRGIEVLHYPDAKRCEAARLSISQLVERENAGKKPEALPGGGVIVPNYLRLRAYCIEG